MMKKTVVWVALCAFMSLNMTPIAFSQTSVGSGNIPVTATVPQFLEFAAAIVKKMNADTGETDPWNQGTDVSSAPAFDFGTLREVIDTTVTPNKFLYMRGQFYYYVLMVAATSGRRYKITETGTQLTGPTTIAKESVLLVPDYQWLDTLGSVAQGAPPSGASVGPVTSACNSNSLVYQSDNAGLGRWVRAVIAIGGPQAGATNGPFNFSQGFNGPTGQGTRQDFPSWKAIGHDQPSGTYTATFSFTLTLN